MDALRAHGAYVWDLGLPVDLLVGYRGVTFLLEAKTDQKKKLTTLQQNFFKDWTGGNLYRVNSPEEAIGLLRHVEQEQSKADKG